MRRNFIPQQRLILKFRFNHADFGKIGALPRVLDAGQINGAHSLLPENIRSLPDNGGAIGLVEKNRKVLFFLQVCKIIIAI